MKPRLILFLICSLISTGCDKQPEASRPLRGDSKTESITIYTDPANAMTDGYNRGVILGVNLAITGVMESMIKSNQLCIHPDELQRITSEAINLGLIK